MDFDPDPKPEYLHEHITPIELGEKIQIEDTNPRQLGNVFSEYACA